MLLFQSRDETTETEKDHTKSVLNRVNVQTMTAQIRIVIVGYEPTYHVGKTLK